jgi:hypothetical protein
MNYKVIPRKNPQNNQEPPKYYAQIVRPKPITLEPMFMKKVSCNSSKPAKTA